VGAIHLLRHGQSVWQDARAGDLDSALTPLGHRQAAAAAQGLARLLPSREGLRLVASPLQRARQTAAPVAAALRVDEDVWPALAEAAFRVSDHLPSRTTPDDPLPPASGCYLAFRIQAAGVLDRLHAAAAGEGDVVAVTHGGMIRTLLCVAARSDALCFAVPNGTITTLEWRDGRWHVARLASCAPLPRVSRAS